jgi:hypothetical protein
VENTDYTVAGNVYTILAAYLNAQPAGVMTLTFDMNGGTDPTTVVTLLVPAPTGLTASKGTHTDKVALSWTAAPGAVGYEIWRNTSSDTSTAEKVSSSDVTGVIYNDASVAYAVTYTYWIKTKGASGVTSAFSASDTGWRGILAPTVTASRGLPREVNVTWSETSAATSYQLWKNTIDESGSAVLLASLAATSYRDMSVAPGQHYFYWVKALCAQGDSGWGTSSEGWCGAAKWDFNGDGRAEPWYYHEQDGRWYVMMTTNTLSWIDLGGVGWEAAPADYDGDGKTDPAVYQAASGTLKVLVSGSGYALQSISYFGGSGYTTAVGDYDGDGRADPAIYAEASGMWQIAMSGSGYELATGGFGGVGYKAVPADYDGDGKTDPAVQEEVSGNWFILLSGSGGQSTNIQFGMSGYVPVPGEYDGLGYAQVAVYNDVSGNWHIRGASGTVHFGMPGYLPIPADYDGDRHDDVSVFYRDRHDATWYLKMSTEGFKTISGRTSRP